MKTLRTQVAIVGGGPAGLMLSHILGVNGIDNVVLERQSMEYVASRIRAGVLEYGTAEVEIHKDSFKPGERVLLLDDLIATGGTMLAAASLIKKLQGNLLEAAAIIDLPGLQGSKKLGDAGIDVFTICSFDED